MIAEPVTYTGPEKQKGDLRLDSLETIDAVDRKELAEKYLITRIRTLIFRAFSIQI